MSQASSSVRTRFAPSPTGDLHLGGARTALYAWLFARSQGGEFILRIEDSDFTRSCTAAIAGILEGMRWLGLDWDQGPYYQSQRLSRYQTVIQQLLESGQAYKCYCSTARLTDLRTQQRLRGEKPRYDGYCRECSIQEGKGKPFVVRFRNPQKGAVTFIDQIRGTITVQNSELDDLILCRSDQTPTYNLCVVIDDWDMGITHVIRGDDHVNNTPRQINLLQALGAPLPHYAHLSMILNAEGDKLSKRKDAASVLYYRDTGYLPQAVLNYLLRLGWSYGDQEIFSIEEMKRYFKLSEIHSSASTFNPSKLLWLNQHYMNHLDPQHIIPHLQRHFLSPISEKQEGPSLATVIKLLGPRCKRLDELASSSHYFLQESIAIEPQAAHRYLTASGATLCLLHRHLCALKQWTSEAIQHTVKRVADELGVAMGQVGMPLRVAVTGGTQSPELGVTLQAIGKERTLRRLVKVLEGSKPDIQNRTTEGVSK